MARRKRKKPALSPLESRVMKIVWREQQATVEQVRRDLEETQPMKDSTARTILRRLEAKGYVDHDVVGRTYIYRPRVDSQQVATDAVRAIIERFCAGSVEKLLLGMVDDRLLTPEKLADLAARIADAENAEADEEAPSAKTMKKPAKKSPRRPSAGD